MIIRSLKLVHFRGVRELAVRDLLGVGVTGVPLPDGVDGGVLCDAVRYAALGELDGDVIVDDSGYAYVELGFEVDGALVSIFRGVDRRGTSQVSLREEGGLRVTGGEHAVQERLTALLQAAPDVWVQATCMDGLPSAADEPEALRERRSTSLPSPTPQSISLSDLASARERVESRIADVRHAARGDQLRSRASKRFGDLVQLGGSLRRTRTDLGLEVERVQASRERVRTRLRRLNEYRDRRSALESELAREVRTEERASRPSAVVEWSMALCTAGWLGALIWIASEGGGATQGVERFVQPAVGVGFLISATLFLAVAQRRRGSSGRFIVSASDASPGEPLPERRATTPDPSRLEALRREYTDLGEPDAPELVGDLRARLAAADAELSPLHTRLERLDDVQALAEVELGRAARALHLPVPDPFVAVEPLDPELPLAEVENDVTRLGDEVFQTCAEREALLAGSDLESNEAQARLEAELDRLGETLEQPDLKDHVLDGVLVEGASETATDDDEADRWDAALARLDLRLLDLDGDRDEVAVGVTLPGLADLADGALREVRATTGGHNEYRTADGEWTPWAELPEPVRRRVHLGLRLRTSGEALDAACGAAPPRTVLLDATVTDGDETLLPFLQRIRPELTSLLRPEADEADEADEPDAAGA